MRIGSGGAGVGLLAHGTQEADTITLVTILTGVVGTPQKRHAHAEQQEETCKSESISLEDAHSYRREIQDHL
ncbi:MAG: hypothetical protein WEB62_04460 [Bacteroidota bacterium]